MHNVLRAEGIHNKDLADCVCQEVRAKHGELREEQVAH